MNVQATPRFDLLDASRAVAALTIVVYHSGFIKDIPWVWGAMDYFFVLSGVLITRTIILNRERGHVYRAFLVYRVARLFPIMILMMLSYEVLVFGLNQTIGLENRDSFETLPYLLLYHNVDLIFSDTKIFPFVWDFSHLWSLIVEEHFYVLWGAAMFFAPQLFTRGDLKFLFIAFLLLLIPIYLRAGGMHWWVLPARYDGFLVGCIMGIMLFEKDAVQIPEAAKPWLWRLFWLAVALSCVRLGYSIWFSYAHFEAYDVDLETVWLDVSCATVISAAIIQYLLKLDYQGVKLGWVRARLSWIGLITYEVYVVHYPITRLLKMVIDKETTFGPWIILTITMATTIPLAYVLHRYISAPALKKRHSIIDRFKLKRQLAT